jgi:hypothetical protein
MQAPFICDYQTANYTLMIEDTTEPELLPLTRESTYSGSNRSQIVEMITSGLQINHNYTLSISVAGEGFNAEVSTALNFSTSFNNKIMSSNWYYCIHLILT